MADKKDNKPKKPFVDAVVEKNNQYNADIIAKASKNETIMKLIKEASGSSGKTKKPPRIAFAEKPHSHSHYAGIFKAKKDLIPSWTTKAIRKHNLLVAAILRARGNTLSMMCYPRENRNDVGLEVNIKKELQDFIEPEQMVKIQDRIDKFTKILMNCGYSEGLKDEEKMTFPQYMWQSISNGLAFGRFATDIVRDENNKFDRFRVADVGTLYPTVKKGERSKQVRDKSLRVLENLTGDERYSKIDRDKFEKDEYSWVQVIEGTPQQAFTDREMIVYDLYPCSDVELNGFPVTPLDTALTSITTFSNIETHNRLYFQNGRGTKGFMVVKSDEIDEGGMKEIVEQYQATINDVSNAFRTPIFGLGREDTVEWIPTTQAGKDGEFQYLFDQVTRNILSAFNISPDELPGFSHLSKGTNTQGLSESNNEFKLTAARDGGLRPLVLKIQAFLNEKLFPIIDPELSQLCTISLSGLDAESRQQESVRLQQDMGIYYDYDTLMNEVEKDIAGTHIGGAVPFNEYYRQIMDTYIEVGKIMGEFCESPASMVDPLLKYKRDPFFFQNMQILMDTNPEAVRAYYKTRKGTIDTLKMLVQDYLDEE